MRESGTGDIGRLPEFEQNLVDKNTREMDARVLRYVRDWDIAKQTMRNNAHALASIAGSLGPYDGEEAMVLSNAYKFGVPVYVGLADFKDRFAALARKSEPVAALWRKLQAERESIKREHERMYMEAKSFYRGTSTNEAKKVARYGGIAAKDWSKVASFSMSEGPAAQYASGVGELKGDVRVNGVLLEYDADSIRNSGKARIMEYDFISDFHAKPKVLCLRIAPQYEVEVERGAGEPRPVRAVLVRDAALENAGLVPDLKARGITIEILNTWPPYTTE